MRFKIKRGLDLPITGGPEQSVDGIKSVERVAVLGADFIGMKPTMQVAVGDRVQRGQVLLSDKKTEGVVFTAPASGEVSAIHRGAKRLFQSVVIKVDGDDAVTFDRPKEGDRDGIRKLLLQSGLWTSFRTRPFDRVPSPETDPGSIFVNAMDSNPLAADPALILADRKDDLERGLRALTTQTSGQVFLCHREGSSIPGTGVSGVTAATFAGPHPSGLVGTHIHNLDPVSANYSVWHLNAQDVCALGRLLETGQLDTERVIAISGPAAKSPRLVRVTQGSDLFSLTANEVAEGTTEPRIVSGSVLNGIAARADEAETLGYLGRYAQQVSVLDEGRQRDFVSWHGPGFDSFSIKNVYLSALNRAKRFAMTTSTNGSPRAMVPVGSFERVMPLDILPTFLLRSLITGDTDQAQALGVLELGEEDLGLCSFVCPGKTEYGSLLRASLNTIERDG